MSVWLTPDLQPVVGGMYFPPVDRYGRPGFKSVLIGVASQVSGFIYSSFNDSKIKVTSYIILSRAFV